MEILQGLMDHQVLQRNSNNVCDVTVAGKSSIAGTIQVRAAKNSRAVAGFNFKTDITKKGKI